MDSCCYCSCCSAMIFKYDLNEFISLFIYLMWEPHKRVDFSPEGGFALTSDWLMSFRRQSLAPSCRFSYPLKTSNLPRPFNCEWRWQLAKLSAENSSWTADIVPWPWRIISIQVFQYIIYLAGKEFYWVPYEMLYMKCTSIVYITFTILCI